MIGVLKDLEEKLKNHVYVLNQLIIKGVNNMLNLLVIILGSAGGFFIIYLIDKMEQKQERIKRKAERRKRWRERDK